MIFLWDFSTYWGLSGALGGFWTYLGLSGALGGFLSYLGAFWCTWRLFIAYSRQRSQCFGDFYRDFSMKSLFSRFVSVVLAGEGAIRTGNFSSNLCFPGSFLWFQLAKRRFVPGFDYEILLFPVYFGGFTLLPLSYFISWCFIISFIN